MTTYTAIPNSDVDQDSPVTQTLVTLLRDNPLAIAEGSTDAPRVQPRALQTGLLGKTSATSEVFDITNIKAVRLDLAAYFSNTSGSAVFQAAFSDDGGSTWGSAQNVFTISDEDSIKTIGTVFVEIDCETGSYDAAGVMGNESGSNIISDSGTLTVPTNANRVRFSKSSVFGAFNGLVVAVSGRS